MMDSPGRHVKKPTVTALALVPLDCAPRVNLTLSAAVLSLFFLTTYIILKWREISEFFKGLYSLAYEVTWHDRRTRYMSCMLSLSCVCTALAALFSGKRGGSWLFFYASLFLQIFIALIRIIQMWNAHKYPEDEQDVWHTYSYLSSDRLRNVWNTYKHLPPEKFEELTAGWSETSRSILLSFRTPVLRPTPKNNSTNHHQSSQHQSSQHQSSGPKNRRKKSKFY